MRMLVVTVSPLLRELVTSVLQSQFAVDVVEILEAREPVAERLRDLAPDLVLLGLLDAETDSVAASLLAVLPSVRVLVLAGNGEHAWLYEPQGRRTVLSDLSAQALREALRDPTAPSGG
jgi:DNA-binding NarL/FixJ family response regulator